MLGTDGQIVDECSRESCRRFLFVQLAINFGFLPQLYCHTSDTVYLESLKREWSSDIVKTLKHEFKKNRQAS